jgi:hypothetical protein
VPVVEPTAIEHAVPAQQSEVALHELPSATQAPTHTLFTQGFPQQSALVAHVVPAGTGTSQVLAWSRQRGTPSASARQQASGFALQKLSVRPSGAQQMFVAEHAALLVLVLQRPPASLHDPPDAHRPSSAVGEDFWQYEAPWTGGGAPAQPQQSLSTRQTSLSGLQPEGAWQADPPAALGPHAREQHACVHAPVPLQEVPSARHGPAGIVGPQRPPLHCVEQHWLPFVHRSPSTRQAPPGLPCGVMSSDGSTRLGMTGDPVGSSTSVTAHAVARRVAATPSPTVSFFIGADYGEESWGAQGTHLGDIPKCEVILRTSRLGDRVATSVAPRPLRNEQGSALVTYGCPGRETRAFRGPDPAAAPPLPIAPVPAPLAVDPHDVGRRA